MTDGGNTIQQIERKDVGVSLDVIPHIMGEDVILQIAQESQSVTNSTAAADIITNKRTLQTVVKVKSQQTIVLGGLISDEEKVSESGVPVLKDIPVLGWFFRSEKTVHQQKELRVVIKTTVLLSLRTLISAIALASFYYLSGGFDFQLRVNLNVSLHYNVI